MKNLKPEYDLLSKLEPQLIRLENFTWAVLDRTPAKYRLNKWYEIIKPRVCALIGFDRIGGAVALRSQEAYDVVYQHLCGVLTDYRYRKYFK